MMEPDNGVRDLIIDGELVCCFLGAVVRQAVLDYNRDGSQEAEQWLDAELPSWRELAKERRGPGRPRRRAGNEKKELTN
jgi:hypothetical protein